MKLLATGNVNLIPSDYAVRKFGNLTSGNLHNYITEVSGNIIDYINSVKPRYYTVLDIEYGIDGDTYSWDNNILTITHNLNTQIPTLTCLVRKTSEDNYEQALIPHAFIPGNLNQIKFDCERIY